MSSLGGAANDSIVISTNDDWLCSFITTPKIQFVLLLVFRVSLCSFITVFAGDSLPLIVSHADLGRIASVCCLESHSHHIHPPS